MAQGPLGWRPEVFAARIIVHDPVTGKNEDVHIELSTEQLGHPNAHIIGAACVVRWRHRLVHDARITGAGPDSEPTLVKRGNVLSYTTPDATVPLDAEDKELHRIAKQARRRA